MIKISHLKISIIIIFIIIIVFLNYNVVVVEKLGDIQYNPKLHVPIHISSPSASSPYQARHKLCQQGFYHSDNFTLHYDGWRSLSPFSQLIAMNQINRTASSRGSALLLSTTVNHCIVMADGICKGEREGETETVRHPALG